MCSGRVSQGSEGISNGQRYPQDPPGSAAPSVAGRSWLAAGPPPAQGLRAWRLGPDSQRFRAFDAPSPRRVSRGCPLSQCWDPVEPPHRGDGGPNIVKDGTPARGAVVCLPSSSRWSLVAGRWAPSRTGLVGMRACGLEGKTRSLRRTHPAATTVAKAGGGQSGKGTGRWPLADDGGSPTPQAAVNPSWPLTQPGTRDECRAAKLPTPFHGQRPRGREGFVARAARGCQMVRDSAPDGGPSRAAAEDRKRPRGRARASARARAALQALPPNASP
jgi:hypothetical protein